MLPNLQENEEITNEEDERVQDETDEFNEDLFQTKRYNDLYTHDTL